MTPITSALKTLLTAIVTTTVCTTAALAQSIVATPSSSTIAAGDTVSIDFMGKGFTDATFGGGFTLAFDPTVLALVSMTLPTRWEIFRSGGLLDPTSGTVSDVNGATFTPIGGDFLLATATFRGVHDGTSALSLSASSDFPFAKAGGLEIPVTFQGGSITVSSVPEPDSLALLLVGVGGVAAARTLQRRRTAH